MFSDAEYEILLMLKDPATRDKGFLKLMDLYKEPIYWHIRRQVQTHEDAEDVLQETFIQVYRHIQAFRGDSKLFTWLFRIALNECARYFKKKKRWARTDNTARDHNNILLGATDPQESTKIELLFQQAIQLLPVKQKRVFQLRYFDELSYEEISLILDSTVNTLKTNYHFACEKIKAFLNEHSG